MTPKRPIRAPKLAALAALGIFAAFAAFAALVGCGHPAQETAAHKIADALPSVLGPAEHYEVQVDGDPFALARGRARAVHIQGTRVRLSPALTVDALTVDAGDVSFDRGTRRLDHIGRATFSATLTQGQLADYLGRFKPLLPGLVVTLRPADVEARVPVAFMGLHTVAALAGRFAPDADDPSRLDFVADGARVGVVPLPAGLVNVALDQLNPVVALTGLKVPLLVTGASVSDRRLTLTGSADLNGLVGTH